MTRADLAHIDTCSANSPNTKTESEKSFHFRHRDAATSGIFLHLRGSPCRDSPGGCEYDAMSIRERNTRSRHAQGLGVYPRRRASLFVGEAVALSGRGVGCWEFGRSPPCYKDDRPLSSPAFVRF